MKIKDAYGDIKIDIRRNSPSDKLVVKEIFTENVYSLRDDMLTGGVVLDIGANIGAFTVEILRRAKHNGEPVKVIAIEPEKNNIELFMQNAMRQNQHIIEDSEVILSTYAVGDKYGLVHITDEHGGSRISDKGEEVTMVKLDTIFDAHKIQEVDIFKIDIEGYEVPTIMAMSDKNFNKVHYWAIEFDEQNGLEGFAELISRLAKTCDIRTLGVPSRGCYIYAERHIA